MPPESLRFQWARSYALVLLALAAAASVALAQGRPRYQTVGDETVVDGMSTLKVEGIGLVVGLRGTGSDPPPNQFRDLMLDIMNKRGVDDASTILASRDTAIVLLRAFIPPGSQKGDMIDVEVWVPPGDNTTSLKGGRLLESALFESVIAKNKFNLRGKELVRVKGPVLVTDFDVKSGEAAGLKKGKVLGTGRVLIDRDFRLVLPTENRSGRRTRAIAQWINQRFHRHTSDLHHGLAKAKDEKIIELKVPREYRYNVERYLLVVRKIPMSNSDVLKARLFRELREDLLEPSTTIDAALRLEAIGATTISILREGLESRSPTVRFASAQSLAYLHDASGAQELGRLAEHSPEFRAYALGALVALDQPISRIQLGRLLGVASTEARYGAFRAFWVFDPEDSQIRGEKLSDEFFLHVVGGRGDPMVHVSRNFRPEIVVFNGAQRLRPPFSLRAGEFILLNASAEADRVHLASFRPGPNGTARARSESSMQLAEVIRECSKLGASYSDIVDMLHQAYNAGNLVGRLEVNALPQATGLAALQAESIDEEGGVRPEPRASVPGLFAVPNGAERRLRSPAPSAKAAEKDALEKAEASKKTRRPFGGLFRRMAN